MEPGPLIASGRDGDIFEYGPGLVLRKTRDGRSIAHEALLIEHVAQHGYPVPRIDDVRNDGTEIVMERIDGPMMMHTIERKPWTLGANAGLLADLHDQLHEIPAPEWLPTLEPGGKFLHMDLHPMNVLMSARGPVVIDWANAVSGEPLTDVANTYALLVGPEMPAPKIVQTLLQPVRLLLGSLFTRRYRGPELDARIAFAAELKCLDANMRPGEIVRLQRLAKKRAPG